MKILVTGATGFIGQHVVPQLLARGHTITAVSRNASNLRNFDWSSHVQLIACDIYKSIDNPLKFFGSPDALIHLAWNGLPNYKEPFHFEENLFYDYSFIKSMINDGLQHLLVSGTCLEYGMKNGCLSERMPTQPNNSYALAKDTLRKFLEIISSQRSFIFQWARLFYMYGDGQNSNSLLSKLDQSINNNEIIFNMSGGEQLRDYLYVKDVAKRLVSLIENPNCNGIVNICSGEPISVRRLVEEYVITRNSNIKLNFGYYPYPVHEPMAFWGDSTKITSIIGGN